MPEYLSKIRFTRKEKQKNWKLFKALDDDVRRPVDDTSDTDVSLLLNHRAIICRNKTQTGVFSRLRSTFRRDNDEYPG
jgi:hypothetical protein